MGKIVVTGGAGFIGSAVVWALNQRGQSDIVIVDVMDSSEKWKNMARLTFADYLDREELLTALHESDLGDEIDGIIHLGACSSTTERDMNFLMENNTVYTCLLAEWCLQNEKRFVYASSAATYGDGAKGFGESHDQLQAFVPLNGYAFSKWLFDGWALQRGWLDRIAGLKFFNVYGPNEYHKGDMRSVVHKAFGQIQETGQVKLFKSHRPDFEDGMQLRDFIYVKDAVAATLAVYENTAANGIFNVGTGQARSFYDLVVATFTALDREPNVEFIDMPEHIREKYQYYTCAEIDRLKQIGFSCEYTLETGVADYVKQYLLADDPYLSRQ